MQDQNSIVLELQGEALDEKIQPSALLRKALVVAKKLRIKDFEQWADKELSGYQAMDRVPDYRQLRGELKAWNPYHGWVPVYFRDAKQAEHFSSRALGQAIPEIETMVPAEHDFLTMHFPKAIELEILKAIRPLSQPQLHINPAEVAGILASVRTIILKWTLKLEEDGILGEGLTFSTQEQEKATHSTVSHVNNFFGPVGQSQIQQHSPKALQIIAGDDVVVTDVAYIDQIKEFVPKAKAAIKTLRLEKVHAEEVESELDTIEAQTRSPKPKKAIITSSLETIQRILEGAAGGAAGQLIYEIGKLLAGG